MVILSTSKAAWFSAAGEDSKNKVVKKKKSSERMGAGSNGVQGDVKENNDRAPKWSGEVSIDIAQKLNFSLIVKPPSDVRGALLRQIDRAGTWLWGLRRRR